MTAVPRHEAARGSMYAVIRTGGRQHRVEKGEKVKIDRLAGDVGASIKFEQVLLLGGDGAPQIGRPLLDGAVVTAKILVQGKGEKIRVFKRRKRKGFHKTIRHRPMYTE